MALVVRDLGAVPYRESLRLQEQLVAEKIAGNAPDYLLLLEHEPVYTLGRGADAGDLLGADRALGVTAVRVGRGGGATFHGPGQLVAYPILDLTPQGRDVGRYVRRLEQVLIEVCDCFGVVASRREGAPGVWVRDAKIASIGIGIRRWIAFHGVTLNVSTDLMYFSRISPCRMPGARATSLECEAGAPPSMAEVRSVFAERFCQHFDAPAAGVDAEVHG